MKKRNDMNRRSNMKGKAILKSMLLCMAVGMTAATADAAKSNTDGIVWNTSIGTGYDSNVYHAPKTPYFDLAQGVQVVPQVQSGFFIPLTLGAKYEPGSGMEFKYNFDANIYPSSSLRNANSYDNTATLGWNRELQDGEFYAGFLAGYHKNTYVDHDTGLAKVTAASGTDISNRYTHFDLGGEVKLKYDVGNVEYKAASRLATLIYNDPIVVSSMDHILFEVGGNARFPLASNSTKLKLGYDFTMRNYTNRNARNAQGVQRRANQLLSYYYHSFNAQLYQKFSKNFMAFLDYGRTYRVDTFVKYNSYTKDKVKLRLRYRLSGDSLMRGSVSYSQRKYPNAFAFDKPAGGSKSYKKLVLSLKSETKVLLPSLGDPVLWSKVNYAKQTTTDLRYAYNQAEVSVGGKWKF